MGGGIAGLSAAWELARAGLAPLLIEARGYTGGLVAGAEIAGVPMDLGAEGFALRGAGDGVFPVAQMAEELGLAVRAPQGRPRLFLPPLEGTGAWSLHRFPAQALLGIPADPLAADVVDIIGQEAAHRAAADRELPAAVGTDPQAPGDLASFVSARMGPGVLERLVRPIVAGIHTADPSLLAADAIAPGLRRETARLGSLAAAVESRLGTRSASRSASVEGGMLALTGALREAIEAAGGTVATRTGAQWMRREAGAWSLGIAATGRGATPSDEPVPVAPEEVVRTGRVVLACSAGAALRLLTGAGLDTEVPIARGAPIARLIMVLRAPGLDGEPVGSGLLVAPGQAPVGARALTHLSVKWPWIGRGLRQEHGPGIHALRLSYGAGGPQLAAALEDVAVLTGVRLGPEAVIEHKLVRWDGTLPPATPEHRERVARLEESVAGLEGLAVTGAWVAGTGIAAVVGHARRAGTRLAGDRFGGDEIGAP
ncbi:NAD(P)/FAD-dependent oxidoreductase [Actinomyces slackii]|uniref:protoporphyrinogen/coproporphyrinogen oxidase n=1 Tax=Actinomyces slackii TaxID=52774 RepID=UPI00068705D8